MAHNIAIKKYFTVTSDCNSTDVLPQEHGLLSATARLARLRFFKIEFTESVPIYAMGGFVRSCIKLPISAF